MSAWAFGRSLLSSLWTKWGPAIRMLARTFWHTAIALLLIGIQIMDTVLVLVRGVMDKAIDRIEDLLDIL